MRWSRRSSGAQPFAPACFLAFPAPLPRDGPLNDGAAAAGPWAPYKANLSIVVPHASVFAPDGPEQLLRANIGQLEGRADVRQAACELGVKYVYHGAASSPEARLFPGVEDVRQVTALEEIFSSGAAAIFPALL